METQVQAFESLQETIEQKREKVLSAIRANGGATLFQLVGILNWPVNRISGRVTELKNQGKIYDSGRRLQNPSSGVKGIVWMATMGRF
jgi:predicted transcriptional regulator